MKKMKNVTAVVLTCVLALGNGEILWAAEDRAEAQQQKEEDAGSIVSRLTGLPYIGGQRLETPLIMQDEIMKLQNVQEFWQLLMSQVKPLGRKINVSGYPCMN